MPRAPWVGQGAGLAGAAGVPRLTLEGSLAPGTDTRLWLSRFPPSSPVFLFFGTSPLFAAFGGGTLVPSPEVIAVVLSDALGTYKETFRWPDDLPPGVETW